MSSFSVMPMSQKIELVPGTVHHGSIRVSNPYDAKTDFHYKVAVYPYSVQDEDYTVDFVNVKDSTQIAKWITVSEPTGSVAPNEVKEIEYTITVPETAPAGGQYAMIGVSSDPDFAEVKEGISVQDSYELASVIFANVAGETVHTGEILSNKVPGFVTEPEVTVSALVTNTGNVHDEVISTITVKNNVTGETVFPKDDEVNRFAEMVMPGSTRFITRRIDQISGLGLYQVTQKLEFMGETSEVSETVVVCPIWFLVLLIVTAGAIIGSVAAMIFRRKKKRRIL